MMKFLEYPKNGIEYSLVMEVEETTTTTTEDGEFWGAPYIHTSEDTTTEIVHCWLEDEEGNESDASSEDWAYAYAKIENAFNL